MHLPKTKCKCKGVETILRIIEGIDTTHFLFVQLKVLHIYVFVKWKTSGLKCATVIQSYISNNLIHTREIFMSSWHDMIIQRHTTSLSECEWEIAIFSTNWETDDLINPVPPPYSCKTFQTQWFPLVYHKQEQHQ